MSSSKPLAAFVVPTGIGASIGGFAGDASRYAAAFAEDFNLIVNPNTVNAAFFSGITKNMLYTEGWTLSQFIKGNLNLMPAEHNKIGVIFDKSISNGILNLHINIINAVKTVYGIDIIGYEKTDEPCGIEFYETSGGIAAGRARRNKTLLRAGKKLIERGAQAIACVCAFNDEEDDDTNYIEGAGIDVIGGIEAVISHYLTRELGVQTVHAPAFENTKPADYIVSPKCAAEYTAPSFLPCLLTGLDNAPLISRSKGKEVLSRNDLKALIMPYNSLGSSIVLDAADAGIKVFAVKENSSVLKITKEIIKKSGIIEIDTYRNCLKILKEMLNEKL